MATRPGALAGARIAGERFVRSRRQQNPEGRMPLIDHLRELRTRVVKMALALAAGMTAGFIFFGQAWHVIERPLCSATIRGHSGCRTLGVNQLVLTGPLDAFYLRVKVALMVAVIVSAPVWLYQVWAFAGPGLHEDEPEPRLAGAQPAAQASAEITADAPDGQLAAAAAAEATRPARQPG